MTEPFDVCWERIRRADAHRQRFAEVWNTFLEREPCSTTVHVNDDGTGSVAIRQVEAVPDELAFILGEFLYQLRASLDACIYEIGCIRSGKRPPPKENTLECPFCESGRFDSVAWKIAPLSVISQSLQVRLGGLLQIRRLSKLRAKVRDQPLHPFLKGFVVSFEVLGADVTAGREDVAVRGNLSGGGGLAEAGDVRVSAGALVAAP